MWKPGARGPNGRAVAGWYAAGSDRRAIRRRCYRGTGGRGRSGRVWRRDHPIFRHRERGLTMDIDLNADLAEGFGRWRMGDDAALLGVLSSANLACGFHAGDPLIMQRTVELAMARGVDIGAHVGFPDRQGF